MSEQLSIDVVGFVCANQRLPNSPVTMSAHKRGIRARFGCDCRLRPHAACVLAPSPCLCSTDLFYVGMLRETTEGGAVLYAGSCVLPIDGGQPLRAAGA